MSHKNRHIKDLFNLVQCHATPGDEDEVREYLTVQWSSAGLSVTRFGRYAVASALTTESSRKPTVLICAHMDSPGYTVEQILNEKLKLIRLGNPVLPEDDAEAILKTRTNKFPVTVNKSMDDAGNEQYFVHCDKPVQPGDRVCFLARPVVDDDDRLVSPFIDNRAGCHILNRLATDEDLRNHPHVHVVIGATAMEEVGCIGAPALARGVNPDYAICLDATYENPYQNVFIGQGPVLTLSDASVILSCGTRDRLIDLFSREGIPLQTEVYNHSGTDSKAFPSIGLQSPVIALLLPSAGNHSPRETAALSDIDWLTKGVKCLIESLANGTLKL